jgi:hypothetical protein
MSTQVEVSRGGESPLMIHLVTIGSVAPLSSSTSTTTSYATPNGVMRVPRTAACGSRARIWSCSYRQSRAVMPSADSNTRALCWPRSWAGSSA